MAWLSNYSYRKSITLSRASGAVTNYQMKLLVGESSGATGENVDCGGKCLSTFNDLRFTKADGTTLLDYWIESISGTTPNQLATVWIEFDSIGTGATTFYLYYGNADATAVSSGANTFLFFDDFDDNSLDTDKWEVLLNTWAETGGILKGTCGANAYSVIISKNQVAPTDNYAVDATIAAQYGLTTGNYQSGLVINDTKTTATIGKGYWLDLTGYDAGKFSIPSISIQKNGENLTTKQLEIDIQDIEVDTAKSAIFPIKPVMEEEYSMRDYWNKYWIYGIVALALFIIAIVLIILYIRAKSKVSGEKGYKTPYDEAKASLKALDAKKYLNRGEQKEYYTQLSFIVRRYLGRIYQFSALEILSDDLVRYIALKQDILPEDVQKFKQFLYDADLVKFAKQEFDAPTNETHRKWVEEFVDRVKPLEIPENEDLKKDQVTGEQYKQFNNN